MQRESPKGAGALRTTRIGELAGRILPPGRFVTGVGAGTTYPDYKPAPFIVSRKSTAWTW